MCRTLYLQISNSYEEIGSALKITISDCTVSEAGGQGDREGGGGNRGRGVGRQRGGGGGGGTERQGEKRQGRETEGKEPYVYVNEREYSSTCMVITRCQI